MKEWFKKYTLLFIALFIVSCSSDEEELPFYVADNGVTIKARDWVTAGTTGKFNGITYTAVDNALLKKMVVNNEDYSKIVTTLLKGGTDQVFGVNAEPNSYNPSVDISTWDVSNITSLVAIFQGISNFNQNLNYWDTSNFVNLTGSFFQTKNFNPKIDKWDVSKVTDMQYTFNVSTGFKGDLSAWNVEKVTKCVLFAKSSDFPKSKWPNFTNCNPD